VSLAPTSIPVTASATSFYVVSGTLPLQSQSYVARQADNDLLTALLAGEYAFVLNSRQMGKSSLSVRTMAALQEAGIRTVFLDLTKIGGSNVTPEQWYIGILSETGRALGLRKEFLAYWKENTEYSLVQRYFGALHDVALGQIASPLVLFIDEIDAVKSLSFSTDEFFAAIRECYNRRVQEPEYSRLAFALVGSATASDLIRDTRTSPFNIGKRIELKDFTLPEVLPLARGIDRPNTDALVERAFYWTNGHPFLTQALCAEIAADPGVQTASEVDSLSAQMFFEAKARERNVNLADVSNRILSSYLDAEDREEHRAAILDLYRQVRRGRRKVVDDETNRLVAVLKLSGITRSVSGALQVRNRIYERVFDRAWIEQSMPDAELRRQRQAYRRGMLRTTAAAALLVIGFAGLALMAYTQKRSSDANAVRASNSAKAARKATAKADYLLYVANMNNAQSAYEDGNFENLERILNDTAQSPERNFEWNYWHRLNQSASLILRSKHGMLEACVSPDGTRLATSSVDQVTIWDATTGMSLAEWRNGEPIQTYSATGKEMLGFNGKSVSIWSATDRKLIRAIPCSLLAYSIDRSKFYAVGKDGIVAEWETSAGRRLRTLGRWPFKFIRYSTSLSPDGKYLAVATATAVLILEVKTWKTVATCTQIATCTAFSPDGRTLGCGGMDGTTILWSTESWHPLHVMRGHRSYVFSIGFSPDSAQVVTGGLDTTARIWDVATGNQVQIFKGLHNRAYQAFFFPDGKHVAACGSENLGTGELRAWDLNGQTEFRSLRGHRSKVYCTAFSPDGARLATASKDGTARIWDVRTGSPLSILNGHSGPVTAIGFSPDGQTIVTGGNDRKVRLWSAATGKPMRILEGMTTQVAQVAISSHAKWIVASGGRWNQQDTGGRICIWEYATGHMVSHMDSFRWNIPAFALSADERRLIVQLEPGKLRMVDIESGQTLAAWGVEGQVGGMALSPDGTLLAVANGSPNVAVRDSSTGKQLFELRGHQTDVRNCAFSPDGKRIVTGSLDGTVRLWDSGTGRGLLIFRGDLDWINSVAFSPDGKHIAATTEDKQGQVRVWTAQ
jgi:WD40 repeat protein